MRFISNVHLGCLIGIAVVGCATPEPSPELTDARAAYARAMVGPAREHKPADLEAARQSLERAEKAFADHPREPMTRDLAYIATRKIIVAEAHGRSAAAEKARVRAESAFRTDAEEKLDTKNSVIDASRQAIAQEQRSRAEEQRMRAEADKRARDALDRLSALAAIKEDQRGTVITLSGSVLFATDKSELLPGAAERLNQVADALDARPEQSVTVNGYTDSQGGDAYNLQLSQRRADAVRQYLIGRGIEPSRLMAVGKGKADAIASNTTAEGRANNRRVEIVLNRSDGSEPRLQR